MIVAILLPGVILITQDDDTIVCDRDELIEEQAELEASMEAFQDALADDPEAALALLYDVGQRYQEMALECGYIPENIGELTVGADVQMILTALQAVNGDPLSGQLLYNNEESAADGNELGCVGCHSEEDTAPLIEGTWTRWDEIRRLEPELDDYTFEHYMVESIVLPWHYIVPGYGETMPNTFGDRLSYQDLADLITYMSSQDQFLD